MIKLKIISPERTLLDEQVEQVTLHTDHGDITVLPGHLPVVTNLAPGELHYTQDKEDIPLVVLGGFAEISKTSVTVLADAAEKVEEILEERAQAAKEQAEMLRLEQVVDSEEYAYLTANIERELTRLKIAQKYRKKRK